MKNMKSKFTPVVLAIAGLLPCAMPVHAQAPAESALEQVVDAAGAESLPKVAVSDERSAAAQEQESQEARAQERMLNHPTCELLLFRSSSLSAYLDDVIEQALEKRGYHVLVTNDPKSWGDAKVGDLRGENFSGFCVLELDDHPFLPASKSCSGCLRLLLVREAGVETFVKNRAEEKTRFGNPAPKAIRKLLDGVPVCRQSVK